MTPLRTLASLAVLSLLAACGGGSDDKGGGSTATGLEGTWLSACEGDTFEIGPLSGRAKITITSSTVRQTVEYFNNLDCSGTAFATYSDAPDTYTVVGTKSVPGPSGGTVTVSKVQTNAVAGAVSFTGSTAAGTTAGTTAIVYPGTSTQLFEVNNQDTDTTVYRDIARVDGGRLYGGDSLATLDADGYPNALDFTDSLARQ